jgi:hypothetical protein
MANGDSFAVQARSRYVASMQGRMIIFSILVAGLCPTTALAGDTIKRLPCAKEQPQQVQQRQQTREQQRAKRRDCPVVRTIPPVVDPTPLFLL